jgi:hypothetical protein
MKEEFSDTKVKLKLGDHQYTVKFGIHARRRIEEACPGFSLLTDQMPDFEVIPFLIVQGIPPLDRKWKDEDEFIQQFDDCTDVDALQKIPLAFQNCLGFTNQLFAPVIEMVQLVMKQAKEADLSTGENTGEQPAE